MIGTRLPESVQVPPSGGLSMTAPEMSDSQCEALFVSSLQESEPVSAEVARAAISRTIELLGPEGCACRMAQEFGDHPEAARDRMRWIRTLTATMLASPAAPDGGAFCRPARRRVVSRRC